MMQAPELKDDKSMKINFLSIYNCKLLSFSFYFLNSFIALQKESIFLETFKDEKLDQQNIKKIK